MSVTMSISYIDITNNEPYSIEARTNSKVITIPASVVEITDNSFEDSIVENIIFMDDSQLKIIGKYAFKNCKFLKSIQIPASVVEIADEVFFDSSLEEIIFTHDSQLKTIGKGVFRECKFLTSITIPDSVTHIGAGSFRNSTIEKVLFGENSQCTTIGPSAFENCSFLKSIEIPSSVLKIEDSAFTASNIQTIIFADNSKLEILNNSTFKRCVSLKSITLPASILTIGKSAFFESGIEQVLFSDNSNLKTIGNYVFINCQFLKSITIPDSVTHIGAGSFQNAAIEGILFGANSQCTTIGHSAFRQCHFLKSIEIPSSVLKIEDFAFTESNIQTIIFADNSRLETIGKFVFRKCKSLESIKIPSSVVAIGYAAFSESIIKEVIFSDDSKFQILSERIFHKCPSLKSITIPVSILEIDEFAFSESGIEEVLFSDNSNLKTIGKGAFYQARLSKPIQIPMSVVEIGEYAFRQCFFTEIMFAEKSKLKTIHLGAFNLCKFQSIKIPDSVVMIVERAFAGCDKLEEVIFSVNSQLETIGKEAFDECCSLKSFIFPQSLRQIGSFAFSLCSLPKCITLLSTSVEFLGNPFAKSGVHDIVFGNGEKIQTIDKNDHFLQLCKEDDISKCEEYLEHNDVNFSCSRNFTKGAMSLAMTTKNVDLIKLLIKNKALMYSQCDACDIKKCFTDDILESVFFESATVFWYSICSLVMKKVYNLICKLLKMLKSKEYFEEWVNIFKNFHQITLQCVTQGDSLHFYHFLIDYDLIKLADLEVKTIEKYFQVASKFGDVVILKKSLGIIPKEDISIKFTDFLGHAPQDKLYSMIEYALPYVMKNEDPLGLIVEGKYVHRNFIQFPETVLSYLAYAQAFDAFKYIIENVPKTQYTPSHIVACSLFRGYKDAKHKKNVDISNFMKLFDYILQDDIRPHVLGEDKEWVGKCVFTCIRFGSSEMCMKLFSHGFDKNDVHIDVTSGDKYNSYIRNSLLSYACTYQSLEVPQFLIDNGVNIDGLLPIHTNCSKSRSEDKHMNDDENDDDENDDDENDDENDDDDNDDGSDDGGDDGGDDDDSDDEDSEYDFDDTTNPERFLFSNFDLEGAWFEPYFNPYRLNKNQDVDIHYESSRPFDPSKEDPLERFLKNRPGERLTLLNVTPLGAAIYAQNLDLVRLLLKNGANPNSNTFSGFPHLLVLGAGDAIDLDCDYGVRSPEVEYPVIEVSNAMEGKKEEEHREEQEKGNKMKMEHKSEDEDVSASIPVSDKKFAIFQELVNHGADLFHEQTVYYAGDTIYSKQVDIYEICSQLNYSLNLLKYLQKIPQLSDKIKEHYIDSFRLRIVLFYYRDAFFPVDTVDYMFQNGYLHFETYKEDDEFRRCIQFERNQDLKPVLEKYGFHFANLSNKTM